MKQIAFLALLTISSLAYGESPLFETDQTFAITIEAPMRDLIRQRMKKPEFDAVVRYIEPSGEVRSLNAKLSSRGNARLATCDYPPIRLDFTGENAVGTVFEGQRKLKMVTPCKRSKTAQSWMHIEYGVYRAYNEVSDFSYKVRSVDVTFLDSTSSRWKLEMPAFVIESTEELAERHGLVSIRPPKIETGQFNSLELMNNALFQLLIANTDFAYKRGPSGEGCCHNGRVLAEKGRQDGWIVVPYDFDQAGIVDTDYALPDERLKIRSVKRRLYRGFCWHNDQLSQAIAAFNDKRQALTAALVPADVSSSTMRRISIYIDLFYEIINDPGELQAEVLDKCRGAATFEVRKTSVAER
jgi:hypothetical protein